jgi:hypothetical protein
MTNITDIYNISGLVFYVPRSIFSRIVAIIAICFIVVSVMSLCLETLPSMQPQECINVTVTELVDGVYTGVTRQVTQ